MFFFIKITKKLFCLLFFFSVAAQEMNSNNLISQNNEWEFISDQVMGGVSFGKKQFFIEEGHQCLRLTGFVSLENKGGFIQIRHKLIKKNISADGISIRARGNDQEYRIHIRTKYTLLPWQYYSSSFIVNQDWKDINLNLKEFKRSGLLLPKNINSNNILSIAIVAFGKEHKVKIEASEIRFF